MASTVTLRNNFFSGKEEVAGRLDGCSCFVKVWLSRNSSIYWDSWKMENIMEWRHA